MSAIAILIGVVSVSLTLAGSFWAGYKAGVIQSKEVIDQLKSDISWHEENATMMDFRVEQLICELAVLKKVAWAARKQLRDRVRPKLP